MAKPDIEDLKQKLRRFADARDWTQFHSPKNLAMALCGEAGELAAQFQWLTEAESANPTGKALRQIKDEIADVQLYLIQLADKLDVDIHKECARKLRDNARKYPVKKSKGNAKKYTDL
jgi:dCTP diphosphatase